MHSSEQSVRLAVLRRFATTRVVELPLALRFDDGDVVREYNATIGAAMRAHRQYHVLLRDADALRVAQRLALSPHARLCPASLHAVGSLAALRRPELLNTRKSALLLSERDLATLPSPSAAAPPLWLTQLQQTHVNTLSPLSWRHSVRDHFVNFDARHLAEHLHNILRGASNLLSQSDVVLTDDVYALQLAFLLHLTVVVLDDVDVSRYHSTWLTNAPNVTTFSLWLPQKR